MDAATPHSVALSRLSASSDGEERVLELENSRDPERCLKELSGLEIDALWQEAECASVALKKDELASVLLSLGLKHNYGFPSGVTATRTQIGAFWRGLQLQDLAIAHACALGRDAAWQQFMARFREPLTQAAISITGSVAMGQELADSLYAELFGLTERGEQRRSPLAYYSGRGSLKGFLRATLAQRNVDHLRQLRRESPLEDNDMVAVSPALMPSPDTLMRLRRCLAAILNSLSPEERFLLSASFLDKRTLMEISRVLHVHEATVSRKLQRLTSRLHKDLVNNLQASGMSRAAAEEALGADPRDLDLNLRTLLQSSQDATFPSKGAAAGQEQT